MFQIQSLFEYTIDGSLAMIYMDLGIDSARYRRLLPLIEMVYGIGGPYCSYIYTYIHT